MKKRYNLLYTILVAVFTCLLIYILLVYRNNLMEQYEIKLAIRDGQVSLTKDIIRSHLTNANKNIGLFFDENLSLRDTSNSNFTLSTLIDKGNKIIFRVSDTFCSSCVDSGIESLVKNLSDVELEHVLIIGSFVETADFLEFARSKQLPCGMFRTKESINIHAEELGFPYFVLVDEEAKILSCFIPNSSYPSYNNDFFVGIKHLIEK